MESKSEQAIKAEIGTDLKKASELLRSGDVVAIPTETVYGLAANALDPYAVLKIFAAKDRPLFDPLICHLSEIDQVDELCEKIPSTAIKLMRLLMPGPLTLLLPRKSVVPDLVTSGLNTVGIRLPMHPLTRDLLKMVGFPLAAPSANLFGRMSPTSAKHVYEQLGNRIKYILDGGESAVGIESTIIAFDNDENPILMRPGGTTIEAIERILGRTVLRPNTTKTLAPGMLKSHYAPNKKLIIVNEGASFGLDGTVRLSFRRNFAGLPPDRQLVLSPSGDLIEAARNFFSFLRLLDTMPDVQQIEAESLPDYSLGVALNDRLNRAAAQ